MYPNTPLDPDVIGNNYNQQVLQLQQWLVSNGWMSQADMNTGPGYYGPKTKAAISNLQSTLGVPTGSYAGYWGNATLSKLSANPSVKGPLLSTQNQSTQPTQSTQSSTNQSSVNANMSTNSGPVYSPTPTPQPTPQPVQQQTPQPTQPTQQQTPTQTSSTSTSSQLFPTTPLTPGMESPDVKKLQEYLVKNGYMTPEEMATGPGIYGPKTILAVTKLQKDIGVDNSSGPGYFGPQTISVLSGQNVQSLMDMKDSSGATITNESATANPVSTPGQQQPQDSTFLQAGPQSQEQGNQQIAQTLGFNGTAYTMGDYSIFRFENGLGPTGFTNNQQVWLMDNNTRTIRPFESIAAVNNFFEDPVNLNDIPTISPQALAEGGILGPRNGQYGYTVLGSEYKINSDGTAKPVGFTNSELAVRYGQGVDTKKESSAAMLVDGFMDTLANNGSGINQSTLNALKNDKNKIAFYINALAYGGYTLPDIYRDIRKNEIGASDVTPISASATREQNKITKGGLDAASDTRLTPPQMIGSVDLSKLNLSITEIPKEAYETLIPILDVNSEEFKSQLNTIQDAYNDVLMQQINAQTNQEKAVADYAWEQLRKDINENYGIQLSSNAIEAGNQLEQAMTTFSTRGISGSGIQNEAIDEYLKGVRRNDQIKRQEKLTKEEAEAASYYLKFGTSSQIKALIDEDKAKGLPQDQWRATKWGLVPSDELKSSLSLENLRAKYPDYSDSELQRFSTSMIDENGNLRSNLYQNQVNKLQAAERDKEKWQEVGLYNKSLAQEEEKYKEFTTPESPFLRTTSEVTSAAPGGIPQAESLVNLKNQIGLFNQANSTGPVNSSSTQPQVKTQQVSPSVNGPVYTPVKKDVPVSGNTQNQLQTTPTYDSLSSLLSKNYSTYSTPTQKAATPSSFTYSPIAKTQTSTPAVLPQNSTTGGSMWQSIKNTAGNVWGSIFGGTNKSSW